MGTFHSIFIDQSKQVKYRSMRTGIISSNWKIGFYVFTRYVINSTFFLTSTKVCYSIKGILSLLIIVLLASGWMFIKPFLSSREKKIISVIIPLQVLANVASAIRSESALGSSDWSFWVKEKNKKQKKTFGVTHHLNIEHVAATY